MDARLALNFSSFDIGALLSLGTWNQKNQTKPSNRIESNENGSPQRMETQSEEMRYKRERIQGKRGKLPASYQSPIDQINRFKQTTKPE